VRFAPASHYLRSIWHHSFQLHFYWLLFYWRLFIYALLNAPLFFSVNLQFEDLFSRRMPFCDLILLFATLKPSKKVLQTASFASPSTGEALTTALINHFLRQFCFRDDSDGPRWSPLPIANPIFRAPNLPYALMCDRGWLTREPLISSSQTRNGRCKKCRGQDSGTCFWFGIVASEGSKYSIALVILFM